MINEKKRERQQILTEDRLESLVYWERFPFIGSLTIESAIRTINQSEFRL